MTIQAIAMRTDHECVARLFPPQLQARELARLKVHVRVGREGALHGGAVVTPNLRLVLVEMKIGMDAQLALAVGGSGAAQRLELGFLSRWRRRPMPPLTTVADGVEVEPNREPR